ncbi:type II toxin-antitoxin system HicB family antitoxin [Calidithermus roseus]|uniref:Antitoxin HicB n=1 Tax=Calidithermus roseus TaxID=1644118 RepID=A0A399ELQ0_9DEIN|nr:type II toxin-antitoxin system HicB family antitoxin [Calidithermus roseus]RIH84340.1 Antitoxin HicB [Calidithermus roseus]
MKNRVERKPLEYYLGLRYPVTLIPEAEGGYTAMVNDLPGCVSVGETVEEAMAMIEDARRLWLEVAYEHGDDIPLPSSEREYGGKVLVRMPPSLHRRLLEGAEAEEVSLNQHIVSLLSEASAVNVVRRELGTLRAEVKALRQRMDEYPAGNTWVEALSRMAARQPTPSGEGFMAAQAFARYTRVDDYVVQG